MDSQNTTTLRCPYCWNELPKQIEHVEAFPHPFLRSQDNFFKRFDCIIRPPNTIERESTCLNCGKKFSITFFTKIPGKNEPQQIFNICKGKKEKSKVKPVFEKFLLWFFTKTKLLFNNLFRYDVYESSQTIFNFIAAFALLFFPFFIYLIVKTHVNPISNLSSFDSFLFISILFAAFLLTKLKELIENYDSKLNILNLQYGLNENYKNSRWGKAFEECYLREPTNEYIRIPLTNKVFSRPMLMGLTASIPYLIFKFAIIEGNLQQNSNYPLLTSISIIPYYLLLFFILGYSFSYSIIGSPVIRIIARHIDLKVDLFDKKDSYQELGDLLEKSMMIFVLISILFSIFIYAAYDSKILTFNFKNIFDFMVTLSLLFSIFVLFSWSWLSSLIDLKDKYQKVKHDNLLFLKERLQLIETKVDKNSDDVIEINKLLFQINRILSKPNWPIDKPVLLSLLPFVSPALIMTTIIRQMGGFS